MCNLLWGWRPAPYKTVSAAGSGCDLSSTALKEVGACLAFACSLCAPAAATTCRCFVLAATSIQRPRPGQVLECSHARQYKGWLSAQPGCRAAAAAVSLQALQHGRHRRGHAGDRAGHVGTADPGAWCTGAMPTDVRWAALLQLELAVITCYNLSRCRPVQCHPLE